MKLPCVCIVTAISLVSVAIAQVPDSNSGVIPTTPGGGRIAPVTTYRAKTKSVFVLPEKGRNPFWPIGYTPRPKSAVGNDEQLLRIPVEDFKVTTIILDTPSIAVINGKDYTSGQFLTMKTTSGEAKLLITDIQDGVVTVQYKAIIGKIPIRRR